jgi:DNA-binding NtrC family response regulator
MKRILIIEDDDAVARGIGDMLVGSERITVGSMKAAKEQMRANQFDIIITDMCLPDSNPEQTLSMVSMLGGDAAKIGISGLLEASDIPVGFDAVANKLDLLTPGELLGLIMRAQKHARSVPPLERKAQAIENFARYGTVCYSPAVTA